MAKHYPIVRTLVLNKQVVRTAASAQRFQASATPATLVASGTAERFQARASVARVSRPETLINRPSVIGKAASTSSAVGREYPRVFPKRPIGGFYTCSCESCGTTKPILPPPIPRERRFEMVGHLAERIADSSPHGGFLPRLREPEALGIPRAPLARPPAQPTTLVPTIDTCPGRTTVCDRPSVREVDCYNAIKNRVNALAPPPINIAYGRPYSFGDTIYEEQYMELWRHWLRWVELFEAIWVEPSSYLDPETARACVLSGALRSYPLIRVMSWFETANFRLNYCFSPDRCRLTNLGELRQYGRHNLSRFSARFCYDICWGNISFLTSPLPPPVVQAVHASGSRALPPIA